jgi:membrane-bound lytic murein transglycosylase D
LTIISNLRQRLPLALLCALALPLAGCPDKLAGTAGSPPKTSAKATAPTLPAATQQTAQTTQAQQAAAAAQAALDARAAQRAQRIQQLIANAETSYNSGVRNYRDNRLDAARLDFDFAVDAMLSSGLDLKAEGPLADELDRLLNAINSLEMDALKQGNGFSPKLEDAPLDTAADLTFAPNPDLVAKLKTELNTTSDLPLVINDQVAGYIGVFSQSESFRKHMAASLQRVGKYRGLIERVLKEEGVPQDLIYLAVAESGFQPQVVNARSGAGGMWQFMTFTGAEYGLIRNGYFDYRFDPEKSSRAYAQYIKKLYEEFGDWYLAMAAYDWGPAGVARAVQRTGYADYWELYRRNAMPAETRAYVPQILAAVIMAKNPERYGLDKLVPSPPVIYDTVTINYAIDMRLVADVTNVSVAEIVALNPALIRLTTASDIPFDLHLPPGTKDLYNDRLKDIPEDRRASWRFHIVKPGETLEGIATALHAKAADIARTNGITPQDPMSVDDELVVPVQSATSLDSPQRYTVRAGDTLVTVADRFNVTIDELRKWNVLTSSSVKPGHVLYVAEPVRLAPAERARGRVTTAKKTSHGGTHSARKNAARSSSKAPAKAPSKTPAKTAAPASTHPATQPAKPKPAPVKPKATQ